MFGARSNLRSLSRYTVTGQLGQGAFGVVLRAIDTQLRRPVAIKVLRVPDDHRGAWRFRQEARALARLNHPNVVKVYDVGIANGDLFIVLELLQGSTLRRWLERARSKSDVVRALLQAGRGLEAAHAVGIVHRDFKPENVMISTGPLRARVVDFGLAFGPGLGHVTPVARRSGTPLYMSPEQLRGEGIDAASDQFSFCVTAYEALCGQRPFPGRDRETLLACAEAEVHQHATVRSSFPTGVLEVLARGLRPRARDRYPSMSALLRALERCNRPRRWRLGSAIAAGVVGVAGAATGSIAAEPACADQPSPVAQQWAEARPLVRTALSDPDREYTLQVAAQVDDRLDRYAKGWTDARQIVCGLPKQKRDDGLRCLDHRKARFGALVRALAGTDGGSAERAPTAAATLPELGSCRRGVPGRNVELPHDPVTAAAVLRLRGELVEIEALNVAGHFRRARRELDSIAADVRATGFDPLAVEAHYVRGLVLDELGEYAEARAEFEAAYWGAVRVGSDVVAADAATKLLSVVCVWGRDTGAREELGQRARAALARLPPDRRRTASLARAWGAALVADRRPAEALPHLRHAVETLEELPGHDDPGIALARESLAWALLRLGRADEAREQGIAALALHEKAFGMRHPAVSRDLTLLANIEGEAGNPEAAMVHGKAAVDIARAALGDQHRNVAIALDSVAFATLRSGRLTEGIEYARQALATLDRAGLSESSVAAFPHLNIASALAVAGRGTEAREHAETALSIRETELGLRAPFVGPAHLLLSQLAAIEGELVEARRHLAAATDIFNGAAGRDRGPAADLEDVRCLVESMGTDLVAAEHACAHALTTMDDDAAARFRTRQRLAVLQHRRENFSAAESNYRALLAEMEATHGVDSPQATAMRLPLGLLLGDAGKDSEGIEVLDATLRAQVQSGVAVEIAFTEAALAMRLPRRNKRRAKTLARRAAPVLAASDRYWDKEQLALLRKWERRR